MSASGHDTAAAALPRRGWRDWLVRWVADPMISRPAFAVVRALPLLGRVPGPAARLLGFPAQVVVGRDAEVRDVLARDAQFTIAEVNSARIERIAGPFILGLDYGEQYEREHAALRRAVRADDLPRLRSLAATLADDLLAAARPRGHIDVVGEYARLAAVRVVDRYFGAPGPDEATMLAWMRSLFDNAFVDDGPRARAIAAHHAPQLRSYLTDLIATRRTAGDGPDDVLGRLLRLGENGETWLDDDAVRRNLSGLIVGAVETTSKAVTHVVEELLRRPQVRAQVRAAAVAGNHDVVLRHVHECLRFRPHQPLVVRHCRATARVGGRRIGAGTTVAAAVQSAMFDRRAVEAPRDYRTDRPLDRYLTFGGGLHECFGKGINEVVLPVLVGRLAAEPGLRRRPGRAGHIRYDGPFPDRLVVELGGQ